MLTSNRHQESFRIHLVDGFCGGGRYKRNGRPHDGSPLILLKTVQETEKEISAAREKEFKIHGNFYFIDEDRGAIAALRRVIAEEGFDINAGNIYINNSTFLESFQNVMDMIRAAPGTAKRTLVVLDQYGYTDVPFAVIRTIFDVQANDDTLRGREKVVTRLCGRRYDAADSRNEHHPPCRLRGQSTETQAHRGTLWLGEAHRPHPASQATWVTESKCPVPVRPVGLESAANT